VDVPSVSYADLTNPIPSDSSRAISERVAAARKRQIARLKKSGAYSNSQMNGRAIRAYCRLSSSCARLMENAAKKFGLSARAYYRILKIARTIADLDGEADLGTDHIAEAVQYRSHEHLQPVH
jgi:magnesium chelatase family protein